MGTGQHDENMYTVFINERGADYQRKQEGLERVRETDPCRVSMAFGWRRGRKNGLQNGLTRHDFQ